MKENTSVPLSTKEIGDKFELYVESLYQHLGYKTQRDVLVSGFQIDIVATKHVDGAGPVCILIECKYITKENKSVSNHTVNKFHSTILGIKQKNPDVDKGMLISNREFSRYAKEIADSVVGMLSIRDLEKEILNFDLPFNNAIKEYERATQSSVFVPVTGVREGTKQPLDITTWLTDKLINSTDTLSILGDYGTGKTTLLQKINYNLLKLYLDRKINKKPILLELKNYHGFSNVLEFVTSNFLIQYKKEFPEDLLINEIENGNIIFLLDGFDEMTAQINQSKRLFNFNQLMPLLSSKCSTCITCRPSYYVSTEEYKGYVKLITSQAPQLFDNTELQFSNDISFKINSLYKKLQTLYVEQELQEPTYKKIETVNLKEFSIEQIDFYLEKFNQEFVEKCESEWTDIKDFLFQIYDLTDLMTKPLLLNMVKDTVLHQGKDYRSFNSEELTPAALYEIYTNIHLEVDWKKGEMRQFLTKNQRNKYAELIAVHMFDTETLELRVDTLNEIAKSKDVNISNLKKEFQSVSVEDIVSDIQICSFITRTTHDTFKFVHKSFLEFYVAKFLTASLRNDRVDKRLHSSKLSKEVLFFIASYGIYDIKIRIKLLRELSKGGNVYRRNIAASVILSNADHKSIKFTGITLDELSFKKTDFEKCDFNGIEFSKVDFHRVGFNQGAINGVFNNCLFESVIISKVSGDVIFKSCNLNNSVFNLIRRELKLNINNSNLNNMTIEGGLLVFSDSTFNDCLFKKVVFVSSTNKNTMVTNRCKFVECIFEAIELNFNFETMYQVANTFNRCKGIFLVEARTDLINYEKLGFDSKGRISLGKLIIINIVQFGRHRSLVKRICKKAMERVNY